MSIVVKENITLAPYTIYKIGGRARFFTEVKNYDELTEALKFAQEKGIAFFILGAGSNILVSDKGFGGLVIRMAGGESKVRGQRLIVDAGVMMAQAVLASTKAGLTGFEWAIGVPGIIGGSVRGNVGCFGGEMRDVVESVRIVDFGKSNFPEKLDFRELKNSACGFSYRDSIFKKHPEWIIVSTTLALQKGDPKEIQARIASITKERSQKQDIGTKSCGCIFKNVPWGYRGRTPVATRVRPLYDKEKLIARFSELAQFKDEPHIPASFLIDQAGLKGRRVGKVFISPKHANFFVNEGGATAEEVIILAGIANDTVRRKYGILLEEEIQYVGF